MSAPDQLAAWLEAPAPDRRSFWFSPGSRPELVSLTLKEGVRIVAHVSDASSPGSATDIAMLVVRRVPIGGGRRG